MGRRCALVVDEVGQVEPGRLSRSGARGEADRARAVPWSLAGETSAAVASRLGVRAEQVRRWRSAVARAGVAASRARPRPGRTPREREAALAAARAVLNEPVADRGRPGPWPGWRAGSRLAPVGRFPPAT
jgi:hypothetical protein